MNRNAETYWIDVVLQDIVAFLRINDMCDTAEILATSALSVRKSLEVHLAGHLVVQSRHLVDRVEDESIRL